MCLATSGLGQDDSGRPGVNLLTRTAPKLLLTASILLAAGMWFYVSRVLVGHQKTEAAIQGNPRGNLSDLYPRWLGSRELLLHGRDPYSPAVTREIQVGYYGRPLDPSLPHDPHDEEAFAYPVYVAFLLAPAISLPFPLVQEILRWVLAALTVLSVVLWLRVVRWQHSLMTGTAVIVFTLGTFWVVQGIRLQQLTLLVAPMIAACLYLLISNRQVACGILLALAAVKPQIAFPLAAWLLLWASTKLHQRWKFAVAFAVTLLALVVAGEFLLPGWIREFYAAIISYRGYTRHQSPLDELVTPTLGIPLSIAIIAVVAVICWRARKNSALDDHFGWTTSLVLAANLLVIPTIAPYNQLLLLPGIFLLLRTWKHRQVNRTITVLRWIAVGCLAWPWTTAAGLTLLSFFTPAAQRFWQIPLWTSVLIPIPITACLGMFVYQVQRSRSLVGEGRFLVTEETGSSR